MPFSTFLGFVVLFLDPSPDPLLTELCRWPNAGNVAAAVELGESHQRWVLKVYYEIPQGQDAYFWGWYLDCEKHLKPWKLLQVAHDTSRSEQERQAALRELRQTLGEADWWNGRLPCPVPLWRFGGER